jgi:hypothetical protein
MLDPTAWLQLLLGTDKRNPCLCLYTNADETELHFYYGLELFQVVPNQRECPAFRLLAGQLYNAGPRVASLDAVLDVDRKTLRTWGQALRSGDPDGLATVLAGRRGRRKLKPELEGYVRARWPVLRAQGARDYRRQLIAELARVFGVKVSCETLRPLFQQLRQEESAPPPPPTAATPTTSPAAEPITTASSPPGAAPPAPIAVSSAAVPSAPPPPPSQPLLLELPAPSPVPKPAPPAAAPAPAPPHCPLRPTPRPPPRYSIRPKLPRLPDAGPDWRRGAARQSPSFARPRRGSPRAIGRCPRAPRGLAPSAVRPAGSQTPPVLPPTQCGRRDRSHEGVRAGDQHVGQNRKHLRATDVRRRFQN